MGGAGKKGVEEAMFRQCRALLGVCFVVSGCLDLWVL